MRACMHALPSLLVYRVRGALRAGLSHILFARPGTQMVEIRIPNFVRPHFIIYSKMAGAGWTDMRPGGTSCPLRHSELKSLLCVIAFSKGCAS
jgi:capsular polysaccharide biosynthesis protein